MYHTPPLKHKASYAPVIAREREARYFAHAYTLVIASVSEAIQKKQKKQSKAIQNRQK